MARKNLQSLIILIAFLFNAAGPIPGALADDLYLPAPGVLVHLSPQYTPAYLKGIIIHPENALKFDFIIYKGNKELDEAQKKEEYTKLTKYFLASLTIPDDDQWVNLSPYEKDRIIKDDFGKTGMGRDLLAQDYMLKQITASLIYPENNLGKKFWDRVYALAEKQFGTTNVTVNTFNKVWILPDDALIYEKGNTAYVLRNHLRVMLEEDYLSLQKHSGIQSAPVNKTHNIASNIVRQIVLPELEREVNEGENFAALRQVYSGMLLATWFKRELKQSLLGQIYVNKAKVKGIDQDPRANEEIYQQYLKAYRKGVFNFIKEDVDKYTNETIPRKYFSGGTAGFAMAKEKLGHDPVRIINSLDSAQITGAKGALTKEDIAVVNMGQAGQSGNDAAMARDVLETPISVFFSNRGISAGPLAEHGVIWVADITEHLTRGQVERYYNNDEDTVSRIASELGRYGLAFKGSPIVNDAAMQVSPTEFKFSPRRYGGVRIEQQDFPTDIIQSDEQGRWPNDVIYTIDNSISRNRRYTVIPLMDGSLLVRLNAAYPHRESIHVQGFTLEPNPDAAMTAVTPRMRETKTILVLDDSEEQRELVMAAFTNAGYRVVFAGEGKAGLKILRSMMIDGVVTDELMMDEDPYGMNGSEMMRLMRQDPVLSHIPAISRTRAMDAQSAQDREDVENTLLDSGAQAVFGKKIDVRDIVRKMDSLLFLGGGDRAMVVPSLLNSDAELQISNMNMILDQLGREFPGLDLKDPSRREHVFYGIGRYWGHDFDRVQLIRDIRRLNGKFDSAKVVARFEKLSAHMPWRVEDIKTDVRRQNLYDDDAAMVARMTIGEPSDGMRRTLNTLAKQRLPLARESFTDYVANNFPEITKEWALHMAHAEAISQFHDLSDDFVGNIPPGEKEFAYEEELLDKNFISFPVFEILIGIDRYMDPTSIADHRLEADLEDAYYQSLKDYLVALGMTPAQRLKRARQMLEAVFTNVYIETTKLGDDKKFISNIAFANSIQEILNDLEDYLEADSVERNGGVVVPLFQDKKRDFIMALKSVKSKIRLYASIDRAQLGVDLTKGGIDLNSANLNLQIKRDGRGVPLPLARQDMAQLSKVQGFVPQIIEIRPASEAGNILDY